MRKYQELVPSCLVLTYNELMELLEKNRKTVEELQSFDFESDDISDFATTIQGGYYYGDITGCLVKWCDNKEVCYENEDIIFVKTSEINTTTCYDYLIDVFKKVGITLDIDYVKNHFGVLTYWYYC